MTLNIEQILKLGLMKTEYDAYKTLLEAGKKLNNEVCAFIIGAYPILKQYYPNTWDYRQYFTTGDSQNNDDTKLD